MDREDVSAGGVEIVTKIGWEEGRGRAFFQTFAEKSEERVRKI